MLSSEIEGIHTTLIDALSGSTADFRPNKDTQLVLNYTKSLDMALGFIREKDMPIVSRIILASHHALMQGGDGERSDPGVYRQQSVRAGDLVPPSAPHIPSLIKDLEDL